jgi:hydrogenase nickel incorporation protein HypA/HybF
MSIAENIREIINDQALKHNKDKVAEIIIEIGCLSGVELEALKIAFDFIKENTIFQDASIQYNVIKSEAFCKNCQQVFYPENIFDLCPVCNSSDIEISKGNELKVKSITFY